MKFRPILTAGIAAATVVGLSACTSTDSEPAQETVTETTAAETTESSETDTTTTETTTATSETDATPVDGEDPVFSAIDAALAEHADGIIIGIDREDSRDSYDIDIVVGDEVIELQVNADGTVREDDRERENDDVQEARDATVTAADAIREALDRHPEGVLDEIDLDTDMGELHWEIQLDDQDGRDLAELELPAT